MRSLVSLASTGLIILLISPVAVASSTFTVLIKEDEIMPDTANLTQNDSVLFFNLVEENRTLILLSYGGEPINQDLCELVAIANGSDSCTIFLDRDVWPSGVAEVGIFSNGSKVGDFELHIRDILDYDSDGVLNLDEEFGCEENPDCDNDGIGDNADRFPVDPNESSDTDGDGWGDNSDAFPNDATEWSDFDGDGVGDNSDNDTDGDGYTNDVDTFPEDSTEWNDNDADGQGDNADTDDDNDGIADESDPTPNTPETYDYAMRIDGDENSIDITLKYTVSNTALIPALTIFDIFGDHNNRIDTSSEKDDLEEHLCTNPTSSGDWSFVEWANSITINGTNAEISDYSCKWKDRRSIDTVTAYSGISEVRQTAEIELSFSMGHPITEGPIELGIPSLYPADWQGNAPYEVKCSGNIECQSFPLYPRQGDVDITLTNAENTVSDIAVFFCCLSMIVPPIILVIIVVRRFKGKKTSIVNSQTVLAANSSDAVNSNLVTPHEFQQPISCQHCGAFNPEHLMFCKGCSKEL